MSHFVSANDFYSCGRASTTFLSQRQIQPLSNGSSKPSISRRGGNSTPQAAKTSLRNGPSFAGSTTSCLNSLRQRVRRYITPFLGGGGTLKDTSLQSWDSELTAFGHFTEKGMEASRSKFDNYLTAIRMLLTRAPQYLIPFWYSQQPMFWLPHGWFPYYAEWLISFPRAPLGSVSIASWQLACTGMVVLLVDLITGIVGLVFSGKQKNKPMKASPGASASSKKSGVTEASEKEKKKA